MLKWLKFATLVASMTTAALSLWAECREEETVLCMLGHAEEVVCAFERADNLVQCRQALDQIEETRRAIMALRNLDVKKAASA